MRTPFNALPSASAPPDHAMVVCINHQHRTVAIHNDTFRIAQLVETVAPIVAARHQLTLQSLQQRAQRASLLK